METMPTTDVLMYPPPVVGDGGSTPHAQRWVRSGDFPRSLGRSSDGIDFFMVIMLHAVLTVGCLPPLFCFGRCLMFDIVQCIIGA